MEKVKCYNLEWFEGWVGGEKKKELKRKSMENPIKYQVQPWTFLIAAINHNEMRDENKVEEEVNEMKKVGKRKLQSGIFLRISDSNKNFFTRMWF